MSDRLLLRYVADRGTMPYMTTVIDMRGRRGTIPPDTFAVRLGIVRTVMRWNRKDAQRATGIGAETWRLWETEERQCSTMEATCRKIAAVTGFSYEWLMVGGALDDPTRGPDTPMRDRPNNPCYYDGTVTLGPWDTSVAHAPAA